MSIDGLKHQEDELTLGKNPLDFSPYKKFMYSLNSHESKHQYPKRLQMFLDHTIIKSPSIEKSCNVFYEILKREEGDEYLKTQLLTSLPCKIRVQRGKMSTETIKNYYKPIKRFCESSI